MALKSFINNILSIPDKIYNSLMLCYRGVKCKAKPVIYGKLYVVGKSGNITLGENVVINSSLKSNPIGGDTRTILFARPEAKISIGDNVGISNSCIFSAEEIIIESNALIGGNCKIYDNDFHSVEYENRIKKPDTNTKSAPVKICNGAFIGAHSIILKGVTIGEKSVVGAGSVVTKSIPPNELWAGNPAKKIRSLD